MNRRKLIFSLWIFFHGSIFISFLVSLIFAPRISFRTSLFDILPPSSALHEIQNADAVLAEKTGRAVTILVKSDSFEASRAAAEQLYRCYDFGADGNAYFDSLSLFVQPDTVAELAEWLYEHRFNLLDDSDTELLERGGAAAFAEEALASAFGAFTFTGLSHLDTDPFLLTERSIRCFLEGGVSGATSMALKDNVLACQKDGFWFVLLRGTVSKTGAGLTNKNSTVKSLYANSKAISEADGVEFLFSGVPFHSYESSSSAQKQISVISTGAILLIIVVFLLIFRSAVPAVVSAVAVVFSCATGFVSVLLFFREMHVLTFVFGTTLIGTCLDYSIHFFMHWKKDARCASGDDVRRCIFRGIFLGFASTEICFAALFLAPFPLLKQVSVFLFYGLAAAFLSVVALYPYLKMPSRAGLLSENVGSAKKSTRNRKRVPPGILHFVPAALLFASGIVIVANARSFRISNNIQELYTMSETMRRNEIESASVLNTGSAGWYFIIRAESEELLLQKSEQFDALLAEAADDGKLGSYLSVTRFIPSEKRQQRSYDALGTLNPLAAAQFDILGFPLSYSESYERLYESSSGSYIHISEKELLPQIMRDVSENLWLGEIDGLFYACVLPLHVARGADSSFREIAAADGDIFFVNKVEDISSQLDELSRAMLGMLGAAFVVVAGVLFLFYRKPALVARIILIPVVVTFVTAAVLLLAGISFSFFPITALVLVFGLGLDYIIYAVEGTEEKDGNAALTRAAILLSFATTALSFGALVFSTFPPVFMLGLTVFAGLSAAVVSSFCVTAGK